MAKCRGILILAALIGCGLGSVTLPRPAAAQCLLCAPAPAAAAKKPPARPITVSVETTMDFAKIGLIRLNQGGTAQIDAATGQRLLTGALIDIGGLPISGSVLIRGEPKQHVEVTFPATIQMFNSSGASYPLTSFATTLKNNPRIEDDGTLRFNFGGLLRISGSATGTFRGSIPITVNYK